MFTDRCNFEVWFWMGSIAYSWNDFIKNFIYRVKHCVLCNFDQAHFSSWHRHLALDFGNGFAPSSQRKTSLVPGANVLLLSPDRSNWIPLDSRKTGASQPWVQSSSLFTFSLTFLPLSIRLRLFRSFRFCFSVISISQTIGWIIDSVVALLTWQGL